MNASKSKFLCLSGLLIALCPLVPPANGQANLLAYYSFDRSSNLGRDFSGNGNGMTVVAGAPVFSNDGISKGAAMLDGSSWFALPESLIAQIGDDFSVSLWIKTTQLLGTDTDPAFTDAAILWADVSTVANDSIPMALTGHKLAFFTGNPDSTLHSMANINTGSFVHVAVTREVATGRRTIYVNGVPDSTDIAGTNSLTDATTLLLGGNELNSIGLNATIDDVQIFSGILDPRQINYLYNFPGNPAPPMEVLNLPISYSIVGTNFQFSFTSLPDYDHEVQFSTDTAAGPWETYTNLTGDGSVTTIIFPATDTPRKYFRVATQPVPTGGS